VPEVIRGAEQCIGPGEVTFETRATALSTMTCPALSVRPGTDKDRLGGTLRLRQSSVTCAECKTKQPPSRKLHDVSYLAEKPQVLTWPGRRCENLAPCTAPHCILHIRRGSERTSEGLRQPATVLPPPESHRPTSGCCLHTCGVFDSGRIALIVCFRPSRNTCGTRQAKK